MNSINIKLMNGTDLQVNEITYGQWKETRANLDEFDNEIALAVACTGLKPDYIEDMSTPDYNEIKKACIKINNPTQDLKVGADTVTLSREVITIMGESTSTIKINMPKVRTSRELAKLEDPVLRMEFMIKSITSIADVLSMPMSDYALLASHVPNFFAQGAAFFQRNK